MAAYCHCRCGPASQLPACHCRLLGAVCGRHDHGGTDGGLGGARFASGEQWPAAGPRERGHIGHSGELILLARESAAAAPREYRLPVQDYLVRQDPPQPLVTLGITPWQPRIPAVLGQVLEGEAADKAGLQAGDEILTVNGKGIDEWMDFVNLVQASPGERLELEVARGGGRLTLALVPGTRELEDGGAIGYVGVGAE